MEHRREPGRPERHEPVRGGLYERVVLYGGRRDSGLLAAFRTLIERWNGVRWLEVASPSAGDAVLSAVTCLSATDCTAVGYHDSGPLIERWNGRSWSVVANPYHFTGARLFGGVVHERVALFRGRVGRGGFDRAMGWPALVGGRRARSPWATAWPGCRARRRITASRSVAIRASAGARSSKVGTERAGRSSLPPVPTRQFNTLTGVSCTSANDCIAVGYYRDFVKRGIIERWDGTRWSIVTIPWTVASWCLVHERVVLHRRRFGSSGTVVERLDGTRWSVVPGPTFPRYTGATLARVSCTSPTDCFAVGARRHRAVDRTRCAGRPADGAAEPADRRDGGDTDRPRLLAGRV